MNLKGRKAKGVKVEDESEATTPMDGGESERTTPVPEDEDEEDAAAKEESEPAVPLKEVFTCKSCASAFSRPVSAQAR
jgi:hypothetical protein